MEKYDKKTFLYKGQEYEKSPFGILKAVIIISLAIFRFFFELIKSPFTGSQPK